ncbi:HAD family hydrolase [bacterium]|nr:HAD family hydrolase [bacterium]
MNIKAVIFDLDGTLLNTIGFIASCMNSVLKNRNLKEHLVADYRTFVGDGIDMLVARALPEALRDESMVALCKAEMLAIYDNHTAETVQPYDGIRELLFALHQRGIVISILSNKIHRYTVTAQKNILADIPFAHVYGARDDVPMKPDPAGALEIAQLTGIAPENTIFVGDMEADVLTAKNAGMVSVGVAWGFGEEETLKELGVDYLIYHPSELLKIIR